MSIQPRQYAVILKDDNGNIVNYIDNTLSDLSWEWDRLGGCGICNMTVRDTFDSVIAGSFAEDYEVNIYAPDISGTSALWYSGYIDKVTPNIKGNEESISVSCLGYVNQLKRVVVRDKRYTGLEIGAIAKDVIENYVTSLTKIVSTSPYYDESGFTADSIYFDEDAYEVINKLSEIAGKREWGVDAEKKFFFRTRSDSVTRIYNLIEDFISYSPVKDFNPIITRIYLLGGNGFEGMYSVTNRLATREQIITNSSIVTQSVGQQYARMYLKENGIPRKSYVGDLVQQNMRIEKTVPIGKAEIGLHRGINNRYDNNVKYNSGVKYDGGTESYQIERIRYVLTDDGINVTLNLGQVPSNIVDDLSKLEYLINNERNR